MRCARGESSPPTASVDIRRNRVCLGALLKCSPQASFVLVLCPAPQDTLLLTRPVPGNCLLFNITFSWEVLFTLSFPLLNFIHPSCIP